MAATGDSFNTVLQLIGQYNFYGWLDTVAAGNGKWFPIPAVRSATIHVKALAAGDSLTVQLSDAPEKPSDTTDGVINQTITGDGTEKRVSLTDLPANFCKVDKAGSTATAIAYFKGLSR